MDSLKKVEVVPLLNVKGIVKSPEPWFFSFKDTLTWENQPFFERMETLILDTHWQLSAIISPFKFTQLHSNEGCLLTSEKSCDIEC